jgi:hypothetical protein
LPMHFSSKHYHNSCIYLGDVIYIYHVDAKLPTLWIKYGFLVVVSMPLPIQFNWKEKNAC